MEGMFGLTILLRHFTKQIRIYTWVRYEKILYLSQKTLVICKKRQVLVIKITKRYFADGMILRFYNKFTNGRKLYLSTSFCRGVLQAKNIEYLLYLFMSTCSRKIKCIFNFQYVIYNFSKNTVLSLQFLATLTRHAVSISFPLNYNIDGDFHIWY